MNLPSAVAATIARSGAILGPTRPLGPGPGR